MSNDETTKAQSNDARLASSENNLTEALDQIEKLKKKHSEELAKAEKTKKASTVRAAEQIKELRKSLDDALTENEGIRILLEETRIELRDAKQRAVQAEATMKHMVEEEKATPPVKTYRKDRVRKSQR